MAVNDVELRSSSRRGMLKVIGSGVIFAAVGAGGFLATRDPNAARQPWRDAGQIIAQNETDPRRKALSFAILAPNPHNRQPWIIELKGKDEIVLYCDADRHIPYTDPFDRQITIGLGAFIETLAIAASQDGFRVDVDAFPKGKPFPMLDDRPVARIRLIKDDGIKADPLFAQILHRRSNRGSYSLERQLPDPDISAVLNAAKHGSQIGISKEIQKVAKLRQIGVEAMRIEYITPRTLGESIDLMRIGKSEIIANPDGISLGGPFFETLALFGQLNRDAMRDPASFAWKTGLDNTLSPLKTGTAYGWLVTEGNSRLDQIKAGRDYARFNLKTTELGIAIHPNSQALQEYEEMKEQFSAIHAELGVSKLQRVQMFVRMGYGSVSKESPRWPLASRIRKA